MIVHGKLNKTVVNLIEHELTRLLIEALDQDLNHMGALNLLKYDYYYIVIT